MELQAEQARDQAVGRAEQAEAPAVLGVEPVGRLEEPQVEERRGEEPVERQEELPAVAWPAIRR